MSRFACVSFAALVGWASFSARSHAQVSSSWTPQTAYPISLASPDSALGVSVNASSLGALPSWSLAYSHVATDRGLAAHTSYRDRFDGAWFATPLGRALAIGTGMEFARARDRSQADSNGFVLGAALSGGPGFSFGASWRMRSPYGVNGGAPDIHSGDLSLTMRPSPAIAISAPGPRVGRARDRATPAGQ
jgi:hypothetical protein